MSACLASMFCTSRRSCCIPGRRGWSSWQQAYEKFWQRTVLVLAAFAVSFHADGVESTSAVLPELRPPWFFDCSNHPRYSAFREHFVDFRRRFPQDDWADDNFVEAAHRIVVEANHVGRDHEQVFTTWANSWDVFYLCDERKKGGPLPQELKVDFCFYGFAVVQWIGVLWYERLGGVPGMEEWARNAHRFVEDASKANAMHFIESSGWPVTLEEMSSTLSRYYLSLPGHERALSPAPSNVGAQTSYSSGRASEINVAQQMAAAPAHGRDPRLSAAPSQKASAVRLRAVAISYHTALIREPLVTWSRMLSHKFLVDTSIHVLDPTARTAADVARLHSHCRFADGAWCKADERLLQLNELLEEATLDCRVGDHKTRHHFISDAEAYYRLFIDLVGTSDELRSADLLLCGEPVYFCRLLSYFGKPVVGYISTPLSVAVREADRASWYQMFREMASDDRHFFAVTTPVFGEMISYATGVSLPVVRPACLYTGAVYSAARAREVLILRTVSIFWDTECILNHFAEESVRVGVGNATTPLKFIESTTLSERQRVGYQSFAEFLAVVIYPYAFSQFWFYEFYSMGMPIFVPSRTSLPLYVYQDYAACPEFGGHAPGHDPSTIHPHSPFDRFDWEAISYWSGFTDFSTYPHIERFGSSAELFLLLETGKHRERSMQVRQAHLGFLGEATTFWLGVLDQVSNFRRRHDSHSSDV